MKTILKDIWKCRKSLVILWFSAFALAILTDKTLNPYRVLLVSFIFSLGVTILGIIYIRTTIKD